MTRILLSFALLLCPLAGQGSLLPRWQPSSELCARNNASTAYDEDRDRIVMFGGNAKWGSLTLDDTWEWDGTRWLARHPRHVPTARTGAAMAFDPVRRKIILYGGADAMSRSLFDMWEWDGSDWQPIPIGASPPAVLDSAVGVDPVRRRVVLFGGLAVVPNVGIVGYNETWEWDGQAWHNMPATRIPTARYNTNLAYSASRQRLVMYGGLTPTFAPITDRTTWEWDGTDWWPTAAYPVSVAQAPEWQQDPILYPDPTSGRVRLHGFAPGPTGAELGVFEWTGSAWPLLGTRPTSPTDWPGGADCADAFDSSRSELVIFGGTQGRTMPYVPYRQTWVVDSSPAWRRVHESRTGFLDQFGIAYDAARDEYIALSRDPNWPYPLRTYRVAAATMDAGLTEVIGARQPPLRYTSPMCFDPISACVVLIGGESNPARNDTWLWDGQDWTEYVSAVRPPGGSGHPVFHPGRGEIIMPINPADGSGFQTWAWTRAGGWRRLQHPPISSGNLSVAYDPASDRLVMTVWRNPNGTTIAETWTFDGTLWQQESPPSGTTLGALLLAPALGGVVAIVHSDYSYPDSHQIWRWTGSDWSRLAVANWPGGNRFSMFGTGVPTVFSARFLYDSGRGRVRAVMHGSGPGWVFEDLLFERLTVNSTGPRLGSTWTATVREPAHAGGLFFLALAAGEWPGIPFRWRPEFGTYERFPLANDWLFQASAAAGLGFGLLDNTGAGSFSLTIPNLPNLIGFRFHAAAITVDPQVGQLGTITNAVTNEIQR
jgi:hypothetical protein